MIPYRGLLVIDHIASCSKRLACLPRLGTALAYKDTPFWVAFLLIKTESYIIEDGDVIEYGSISNQKRELERAPGRL